MTARAWQDYSFIQNTAHSLQPSSPAARHHLLLAPVNESLCRCHRAQACLRQLGGGRLCRYCHSPAAAAAHSLTVSLTGSSTGCCHYHHCHERHQHRPGCRQAHPQCHCCHRLRHVPGRAVCAVMMTTQLHVLQQLQSAAAGEGWGALQQLWAAPALARPLRCVLPPPPTLQSLHRQHLQLLHAAASLHVVPQPWPSAGGCGCGSVVCRRRCHHHQHRHHGHRRRGHGRCRHQLLLQPDRCCYWCRCRCAGGWQGE